MREVPGLAAVALLETGEHELRAHRTVADETACADGFMKEREHGKKLVERRVQHR